MNDDHPLRKLIDLPSVQLQVNEMVEQHLLYGTILPPPLSKESIDVLRAEYGLIYHGPGVTPSKENKQ